MNPTRPRRPAARADFEIAVICALSIEADAVEALFDHHWDDDGPPYDKAAGDPNAYSAGAVGRHNVVLAHMPGMGKASAAAVATNCRASFPNIKLALIVGVCGVVPFQASSSETAEIVLGDVIVSDGVVQYDLGRRLPEQFVPKDTLLDTMGRPNTEIRALLAKLKGVRGRKMLQSKMAGYIDVLRGEPKLAATYPGVAQDRLFEATYRHIADGMSCEECACNGELVRRTRLEQSDGQPTVHFGLIASGDMVMKSGKDRDTIARQLGVVGFEMEGAGVWDIFPCVVIKGACDYADSHKNKVWQRYAAATAAACMKAFLGHWVPSSLVGQNYRPISAEFHLPPERPETPPAPFANIPFSRDPDFVNRGDVLDQLHQRCSEPAARVALVGLGGVGKSQLAIEYSHRICEGQPDTWLFWVHAGTQARVAEGFRTIADTIKLPGRNQPKANIPQLVYGWLSKKRNGRWIMVLDSADDGDVFYSSTGSDARNGQPFATYLPQSPNGSIIITTRNKDLALRLTGRHQNMIEVGPMAQTDALTLLEKKLGLLPDPDIAAGLVSTLDFVPLAISQAAAYIQSRAPRSSPEKYLVEFQKSERKRSKLLEHDAGDLRRDGGASNAILTTWQISFEHIRSKRPSAADLLSLMSFFDRQGIPGWVLNSSDDGSSATAGDTDDSTDDDIDDRFEDDIAMLRDYCLIVADEARDEFEMHGLVQLSTRRWLRVFGRQETFKQQCVGRMAAAFPTGEYENWATCRSLFAHVQVVFGYQPSEKTDEAWATLMHNGGWYAWSQGRYEVAQQMLGKARKVLEEKLGAEDVATLESKSFYAMVLSSRGRWEEAEKLFVQVMETRKTKLRADHPSTLTSMANLASTYRNQGRWEEAEKLEVQVMETRKTKFGADHPSTLTSMANLASTYRKQGRWEEAEKLEVQVMETRKTKLGADHPSTLNSIANLASTYWNQGRWEEAEKLDVQVMETCKTKLGADHPSTLNSIANLASTYWNQGRWEEAEKLDVQVMETCKTKLGADHPDTLNSIANLASTYRNQGRWEEAEKLEVQVMETRKTKLGAHHPDTLNSIANLASTYWNQGRWEEAEKLEVQVMETCKTKLRADHPDTLTSIANLASTYRKQGRWEEAEKLDMQVMETRKTKLGADHPSTLNSIANLASTYWNQGRWEEAEKLDVQVMETRKTKLGADHPDTLTSMHNLAFTWKDQGRHADALALMEDCAKAQQRVLGLDHPDTRSSSATVAKWRS